MEELTGLERITNIRQRQPVDRIGFFEHFWSDTQRVWTEQGHIQPGESERDEPARCLSAPERQLSALGTRIPVPGQDARRKPSRPVG